MWCQRGQKRVPFRTVRRAGIASHLSLPRCQAMGYMWCGRNPVESNVSQDRDMPCWFRGHERRIPEVADLSRQSVCSASTCASVIDSACRVTLHKGWSQTGVPRIQNDNTMMAKDGEKSSSISMSGASTQSFVPTKCASATMSLHGLHACS